MKQTLLDMKSKLEKHVVLPSILYAELQDMSFQPNAMGAKLAFAFNEARKENRLTLNKFKNSQAVLHIALLTF